MNGGKMWRSEDSRGRTIKGKVSMKERKKRKRDNRNKINSE